MPLFCSGTINWVRIRSDGFYELWARGKMGWYARLVTQYSSQYMRKKKNSNFVWDFLPELGAFDIYSRDGITKLLLVKSEFWRVVGCTRGFDLLRLLLEWFSCAGRILEEVKFLLGVGQGQYGRPRTTIKRNNNLNHVIRLKTNFDMIQK